MIRHATIAVLACFYVAASVWVVRRQGQAYREALRRDRLAAVQAGRPAVAEIESKTIATRDAVSEVAPARPEGARAVVVGSGETERTPAGPARQEPHPPGAPPGERALQKAQSRRESGGRSSPETAPTSPVSDRMPESGTGKSAAPADPLANNPFWNLPEMTRNWDVANLSDSDEQKLGAQLHDVIVQLNPVVSDGPWRHASRRPPSHSSRRSSAKDITYKFEIMDSDEVNVFYTPAAMFM